MTDLSTFELVAGVASILSVLFVLITLIRRAVLSFCKKRDTAEKELAAELARLRSAGATVSARTDLGFFIILETNSVSESINSSQHDQTFWGIVLVVFLGFTVIFEQILQLNIWFALFCLIMGFGSLVMMGVSMFITKRYKKYMRTYRTRVKEIWEEHVNKRSRSSQEIT